MKDLEVVPECCAKFVVTELQESITVFQVVMVVVDSLSGALEGKI